MSSAPAPVSSSRLEAVFCSPPPDVRRPDVLFLGSAIGLAVVPYLLDRARPARPSVVVADAGPFDLLTHMAHAPGFPRFPILNAGAERLGGRLTMWGVSAPRPPDDALDRWPYDKDDLKRRFAWAESVLGVPDRIPMAGRRLEAGLLAALHERFPECVVRPAPLAIDRDGRRYCPLAEVPRLRKEGVRFLARFRGTELIREGHRVVAVRGRWADGKVYTLRPRVVVLAVGVEPSLPLLRPLSDGPLPLQAADHLRIDLHGRLPAGALGPGAENLGVAVLLMERRAKQSGIPYHLEIKVAPKELWARGFMQSSDNLSGADADDTLYVQVQAVCAMHDRLPSADLLQVEGALPPVMSGRDVAFHGEVVEAMTEVAAAVGLARPLFNLRPLLTNHHTYGAFRVGGAVNAAFQFGGFDNLFVLPPTSYVDHDDDANPTLKSIVLSTYAMDEIAKVPVAVRGDAA